MLYAFSATYPRKRVMLRMWSDWEGRGKIRAKSPSLLYFHSTHQETQSGPLTQVLNLEASILNLACD